MEDDLVIYTDGSSAPNPRKGGVAFRMIFPDGTVRDFSPNGYLGATNNEMELQACILSLKEVLKLQNLEGVNGIIVRTDSQYVVNNYKNAMFSWPRTKWMRTNGEPVLNALQWKELVRQMKKIGDTFHLQVSFEKVKGHSGVADNVAVDKLAKLSRKKPASSTKISISTVRKSLTDRETLKGSIKGEGQRVRIRIVTASWLSVQRLYRLRCEILSRKSKYFKNMDFILSETALAAGHVYDVVLEDNPEQCRIQKVLREIKKDD